MAPSPTAKIRISANLIVYNEEDKIQKCLDALKGAVDEIIVVHDGPCTDRTLEIAKKYTKKIFVREHWGEASPHKPFALEQSTGEWILTVDADEIVTPELRKQIRRLVEEADREGINGYAFYWPFYEKGVRVTKGPLAQSYKLVLFCKSKTTCSGVIHAWYHVEPPTKKVDLELDHRQPGDNWSFKTFFKKNAPRTIVDAKHRILTGHARQPAWWYLLKAPLWFVLYITYSFILSRLLLHGRLGLRLAIQFGLYNFLLNYPIFRMKRACLKAAPLRGIAQ